MADGISKLVSGIAHAANELKDSATQVDAAYARRSLLLEAKKLVASLEDPSTEVWPRAFQVNVGVAVDVASKMGIWEKLRCKDTISVAEIAKLKGADEVMIIRIFRQLTAAGVLDDIAGPGYAMTSLGNPYLEDEHVAFNRFLLKEVIPTVLAMPGTLRERGYKAPTKDSGMPYQWAHGEELWTFLSRHPERARDMVQGMKSLSTGNLAGDAYPFGAELAKLAIQDGDVAIVDVAGGQGHVMEEVRRTHASINGRIVVQDLPSTFEAVAAAGPPAGLEFMVYDMFTTQPVRDAHVYYFRHIFHDWNGEDTSRYLQRIVEVLRSGRPGAKLLLVDLVLPNENVDMLEAVRDFPMFHIGGLERNENQWRELLAKNGLKIKEIWRGSEPEACVECELDGSA